MTDSTAPQVQALEERLAFLDEEVRHLSHTVADQQRIIDALQRQLTELTDRLREVQSMAPATAGHERPPHY